MGGARVGLGVADEPAHPLQPRLRRPRRQAVVGAQALRLVGRRRRQVDRRRRAGLQGRHGARLRAARGRRRAPPRCAATSRSSCRPTARAGSSRPRGWSTARCPRTTSRTSRPFGNPLYAGQQANPARQQFGRRENPYNPTHGEPGAEVFPYVVTTYRLTEHHTAGGMSRWLPYLAELQPEMFCEVSPALARRARPRARRLDDDRHHAHGDRGAGDGHRPHDAADRSAAAGSTRSACPTTGARAGFATGDSANDLLGLALDPNVHIGEYKAQTCDVRPGRRPRGPALRRARRATTAAAPA